MIFGQSERQSRTIHAQGAQSFPFTHVLLICTECVPEAKDYIGRDICLSKEIRITAVYAARSGVGS